ncbi:MAG: hypothetical protein E7269_02915 [Lachnospiraceae bacterium]|nr:hypothetical protein [Lachnospiraceae bacterium]
MKKKILVPVVVAVLFLAVIYFSFFSYYQTHFLPNTTINGVDCSGKTAQKAEILLDEAVSSYMLRVRENKKTEFFTAAKLNLTRTYDEGFAELLKEQSVGLWFVALFKKQDLTVASTITYSEDALRACMEKLACMNPDKIVEPVDAYIDEVDGEFVIIEDQAGNEVDSEKLYTVLKEAVDSLAEEVNLEEHGIYKRAEVTADNEELLEQLALCNEYKEISITIPFGETLEVIDTGMILNWLVEDAQEGMVVSEAKVKEYVQTLATEHNTFGTGLPREFTAQDGTVRSIYGGDYGWWMNQADTAAAILEAVNGKKSTEIAPVWRQEAASHQGLDYGNTYCEVDISKQHVWIFVDGELVFETDCVTGKVSTGHDTPTGCFKVRFKRTNYTLVGQDYESKVSYWVPFYDDVGFHDASWRNKFGGTIYLKNGSHGCVNLPVENAKTLYDLTYVGMPVFVYESK